MSRRPTILPPLQSPVEGDTQCRPDKLVRWKRRADVLTRVPLPCLASYHALNLTAGCPNGCVYCYAQHYDYLPPRGTMAFYANVLKRLKDEFPKLRKKPRRVYLSTACEPFVAVEPVLHDLHAIAEFLLDAEVFLLVSTKGIIQERFAELFGRYPGKVHVQVGMTTVDDKVRKVMEPRAATVAQRLENIRLLRRHGVHTEVRMDPLIPGLTDSEDSFCRLFYELSRLGLHSVAASFLFLRWGIRPPRNLAVGDWTFQQMRELYTLKITGYCGKGTIWLPPADYRSAKFATLKDIAQANDIAVHLCRCKNEDIVNECCHPQPGNVEK